MQDMLKEWFYACAAIGVVLLFLVQASICILVHIWWDWRARKRHEVAARQTEEENPHDFGDTNFFEGRVTDSLSERFSKADIPGLGSIMIDNDKPVRPGDRIHLSLRPEKIILSRNQPSPGTWDNILQGTIEDVIEPYLIQQGYLQRTPRGRIATLAAYRHLGVTPPAGGAGDLFGS